MKKYILTALFVFAPFVVFASPGATFTSTTAGNSTQVTLGYVTYPGETVGGFYTGFLSSTPSVWTTGALGLTDCTSITPFTSVTYDFSATTSISVTLPSAGTYQFVFEPTSDCSSSTIQLYNGGMVTVTAPVAQTQLFGAPIITSTSSGGSYGNLCFYLTTVGRKCTETPAQDYQFNHDVEYRESVLTSLGY